MHGLSAATRNRRVFFTLLSSILYVNNLITYAIC